MKELIAIFDRADLQESPNGLESVITGGNHYSVLVTNDSAEVINVNGLPVYPQTQFIDEKPPVIVVDAITFAKSAIAYDIPVICPAGTDLSKIYITKYYFAGVK
jgi:hypothetical protein